MQVQDGTYVSSMVEDASFLVHKSLRRSVSTRSEQAIMAVCNRVTEVGFSRLPDPKEGWFDVFHPLFFLLVCGCLVVCLCPSLSYCFSAFARLCCLSCPSLCLSDVTPRSRVCVCTFAQYAGVVCRITSRRGSIVASRSPREKAGQRIVDSPVAAAIFAALCNTRRDSIAPAIHHGPRRSTSATSTVSGTGLNIPLHARGALIFSSWLPKLDTRPPRPGAFVLRRACDGGGSQGARRGRGRRRRRGGAQPTSGRLLHGSRKVRLWVMSTARPRTVP